MNCTKQPWTLDSDDYAYIITGPNSEPIAEVGKEFDSSDMDPTREGNFTSENGLSNARLIVAAPDLYFALQALLEASAGNIDSSNLAVILAESTIAKAEGK